MISPSISANYRVQAAHGSFHIRLANMIVKISSIVRNQLYFLQPCNSDASIKFCYFPDAGVEICELQVNVTVVDCDASIPTSL